jgi:hypothetical protein
LPYFHASSKRDARITVATRARPGFRQFRQSNPINRFQEVFTVRYQHYKGGIYELVCEATLESDPSVTMIVYRAANGTIWTRPASVFFEPVEHEGGTVPRFKPVN